MTITFEPEPDVADQLEKLCQVANLEASEVINILIASPLNQIIEDRDAGLLRPIFQSFEFNAKEEALQAIAGYERFVSEDDSFCYSDDAKPARTRDGHWEILFKSTHPDDEGVIYR